jgi:hypothetical protein
MYCDVGTDPDPTTGTTILDNPGSPADGILDQLVTNCQYSVEWVATASLAGPYDYTITVEPGTVLRAECPFYSATWLGELKFTAKDGVPNNAAIASPAPFLTPGYMTCPNLFTIAGLSSFSVFRVHGITDGTAVILPIELLDFTGQTESLGNRLFWATENETNNDYFGVESSADAIHFKEIGVVDGAGTTTERHSYSFLDEHPIANTTYYRLRTVDFNGVAGYSNTISLTRMSNEQLLVSPVPAMTTVNVTFTADLDQEAELSIVGMDGKTMYRQLWTVEAGQNVQEVDITSWMPGTYVVQVDGSHAPLRTKLIKQ